MRLLLDTHMLLWALVEPRRLPKLAASHIRERSHEILYSSVSIWEIALKAQAGIVDEDVDAPERVQCPLHQGGDLIGLTDVGRHRQGAHRVALR